MCGIPMEVELFISQVYICVINFLCDKSVMCVVLCQELQSNSHNCVVGCVCVLIKYCSVCVLCCLNECVYHMIRYV